MNFDPSTITTDVSRGMRGDLTAKTEIALSEKDRVLQVRTYKSDRGLLTTASSFRIERGDGYVSHVHALYADFSKRIALTNARGTEKAIRTQHAAALADAAALVAEAEAFYAAKAVKQTSEV